MARAKVLFLDDMRSRHQSFGTATDHVDADIYPAYSAHQAKSLLDTHHFDQVFLDHDLSEEDIMIEVGAPSKVPTGMEVVDHILKMPIVPRSIFVHSCNSIAAMEMEQRLRDAGCTVSRIPFPTLIKLIA